ncbi:hypothetical protein D3C81_1624860 [compost metagenome]
MAMASAMVILRGSSDCSRSKNCDENSRMPTVPAMNTHLKPMRSASMPQRGMVKSAMAAPQTVASSITVLGMPSVPVA